MIDGLEPFRIDFEAQIIYQALHLRVNLPFLICFNVNVSFKTAKQ